jgi:hypothetical protein
MNPVAPVTRIMIKIIAEVSYNLAKVGTFPGPGPSARSHSKVSLNYGL